MILYLQQLPLSTDWQLISSSMPEKCYFLKRRHLPPTQWLLRLLILLWIWWTGRYTGWWQQPGQDSREIKRLLAACDMDLKARCPKVQSTQKQCPVAAHFSSQAPAAKLAGLVERSTPALRGTAEMHQGKHSGVGVRNSGGVHYTALLATSCETWENPLNSYSVSLPL